MSKEFIEKIFKKLPEGEQKRAVVYIEGKVYTWEEALSEIQKNENSDISKKIQEKIEQLTK